MRSVDLFLEQLQDHFADFAMNYLRVVFEKHLLLDRTYVDSGAGSQLYVVKYALYKKHEKTTKLYG